MASVGLFNMDISPIVPDYFSGLLGKPEGEGKKMNELFWGIELTCWDNEGGDDAAAAAAAAAEAAAATEATAAAAKNAEKTFTQEEVNKFVAERNKTVNAQLKVAEENYESSLKQTNLSQEQRDKVTKDLKAVRDEMMTKEQRLESEKKKAEEKHTEELEVVTAEALKYKNLYETSTINREIQDAAIKADGFAAGQFISHLAPKSKMVDEVDSAGELTGKMVPRVEWTTVDEETGAVVVTLKTPEEAVELMKENTIEFGNMFKPNVAAGIGQGTAPGQSASSSGTVNQKNITDAEYMELAKDPAKLKAMLGKT